MMEVTAVPAPAVAKQLGNLVRLKTKSFASGVNESIHIHVFKFVFKMF